MTEPASHIETLQWWFVYTDIYTNNRFVIGWLAMPGEPYGYLIRTAQVTYINRSAKMLRTLFVDYRLKQEMPKPEDWMFYSSVFGDALTQHTKDVLVSVPISDAIN